MLLIDIVHDYWDSSTTRTTCPKFNPDLPYKDVRVKQKKKYRVDSHKLEIVSNTTGDLVIRRAKRGKKIRAFLNGIANMNEHCSFDIT